MRLLLFGGTFDPPHLGHLHNLRAALTAVRPDAAVVMPAGTPPHKTAAGAPAALRLQMCACFAELDPRVTVSDWELRRPGPNYTVATLEMLAAAHPGAQLFLAVGSDMLLTFTKWYRWRDILGLAALVVQSRAPGDGDALHTAARGLEAAGGRVLFTGEAPLACASSAIRAGLAAGDQDAWALLPPQAAAVIAQNGLYGAGTAAQNGEERP